MTGLVIGQSYLRVTCGQCGLIAPTPLPRGCRCSQCGAETLVLQAFTYRGVITSIAPIIEDGARRYCVPSTQHRLCV